MYKPLNIYNEKIMNIRIEPNGQIKDVKPRDIIISLVDKQLRVVEVKAIRENHLECMCIQTRKKTLVFETQILIFDNGIHPVQEIEPTFKIK